MSTAWRDESHGDHLEKWCLAPVRQASAAGSDLPSSAGDCGKSPALKSYGRAGLPSGQRVCVQRSMVSWTGYFAARSSSMSMPRPGLSLGYM